jgi:hypothetical protein
VAGRGTRIALVAGLLVLGGCAATPADAPAALTAPQSSVPAGAGNGVGTAPAAARMPCSDEARAQVRAALDLATTPAPEEVWADHVGTCTYTVPAGRLVYQVAVEPDRVAARDHLYGLRTRLGAQPVPELGDEGYRSPAGLALAVKDEMVLTVDATGLPDGLGPDHRTRSATAVLLARGVLACWTGS